MFQAEREMHNCACLEVPAIGVYPSSFTMGADSAKFAGGGGSCHGAVGRRRGPRHQLPIALTAVATRVD